jgi:hypothetical protein
MNGCGIQKNKQRGKIIALIALSVEGKLKLSR